MKQPFKVACLQVGSLGPDPETRRVVAARLVQEAHEADLIVLPELWTVGYFAFDDYEAAAEPLDGPTVEAMSQAARSAKAHVVLGSFVERSALGLHNTTVVLGPDGALLAHYRKMHVFGYRSRETELVVGGAGSAVVATGLGKLGLAICYDLRFPELFREMTDSGAEMFVIPAAWPAARTAHWQLLVRARAVENQAYVIACNGAGGGDGTTRAGCSAVIDPWGETIAEAGVDATTLRSLVEPERIAGCRAEFPALADRRLGRAPEAVA